MRCRILGLRRLRPRDQFSLVATSGPVLSNMCSLSSGTAGLFCSQDRSVKGSTTTWTWSTVSGICSLPYKAHSNISVVAWGWIAGGPTLCLPGLSICSGIPFAEGDNHVQSSPSKLETVFTGVPNLGLMARLCTTGYKILTGSSPEPL